MAAFTVDLSKRLETTGILILNVYIMRTGNNEIILKYILFNKTWQQTHEHMPTYFTISIFLESLATLVF